MKYLIIILAVIIAMIILVFIESSRECKRFRIKHYTLDDISGKGFSELKIAMLADLHNTVFDGDNSSLVKAIKEYEPDMIILAGDMIVCREKQKDNNLSTARFVNRLCDIAPVYYGMGNHERGIKHLYKDMGDNWERYVKLLDPRVSFIVDDHIKILKDKVTFAVYGLDLTGEYYSRLKVKPLTTGELEESLGTPKDEDYNILIAHNPDYFKVYAQWGANLVLAGHNHGGLVNLPMLGGVISPRLHIFPKYTYGLYKKGDSKMILTNGLGAHSMKIRVNNIPELVFVHIKSK